MKEFKIIIYFFIFALFFISAGCSEKTTEDPKIAQIGNYKLYVSDFRRDANKLSTVERLSLSKKEQKLAFLDQLIDREVLLQEAQELKLDRNSRVMKKVEDFWEEALLEELIRAKSVVLVRDIKVNTDEVNKYYEKMKKKVYARIVITEKADLAKTFLSDEKAIESYKQLEEISDSGWQWFFYEELDQVYRDIIFAMNPGDKKVFLKQKKGWFIFYVSEFADRELGAFDDLKLDIEKLIQSEKEIMSIDNWINSLRAKTKISVDKEILYLTNVE